MKINITKNHKSIPAPKIMELPKFSVITGKNGSGKSHLLEALSDIQKSQINDNGKVLTKIKYIPFNGLNPTVDEQCDSNTIVAQVKSIWNQFYNARTNLFQQIKNGHRMPSQCSVDDVLNHGVHDQRQKNAIKKIIERSEIPLESQTEDSFRKYLDFTDVMPEEMFASQFATIFKAYHLRLDENQYALFRNEKYGDNNPYLSDEDFIKIYGPAPWDLINQILENAKLPYRVNTPIGQARESNFRLTLNDQTTGLEITINDLSTGEKVLMSLALAIYNSTEKGTKLDLLLLDEPDAALHPEFSKLLIDTLVDYIVDKAGVNVIITTHSPTTVAACVGISIFEMSKTDKIPLKISTIEAIKLLTDGLNGVRISNERRRQVFVESLYDANYYEKIHALLTQNNSLEYLPQFLPPHSRNGSNCDDVEKIVTSLVEYGNDLVFGIIDHDGKKISTSRLLVLGNGNRYSIENYLFDPLALGFLLIRQKLITCSEIGLTESPTYVGLTKLTNDGAQKIVNFIIDKLGLKDSDLTECRYINSMKLNISKKFLNYQGHDLESLILKTWPGLNSIKRGSSADNVIKDFMIDNVLTDYPEIISYDFLELLQMIN